MHLNSDTGGWVLMLILAAISGGINFAQATRAGHPRRRFQALLWVAGFLCLTVAAFLPPGTPRQLADFMGLGILCYSLWIQFTLPVGEKPKWP